MRADIASIGGRLRSYLYGRRSELIDPEFDTTPICMGNYTDLFMTRENRRVVPAIMEQITSVLNPRLLVFITKSGLDREIVDTIDGFGWPVLWFFSQSFAFMKRGKLETGPVADFDTTIGNAELVAGTEHQSAAHFWRPFVRELVPPLAERPRIIERLQRSGMQCSVVIGMARGPGTPVDDVRLREELPSTFASDAAGEVLDHDSWQHIRATATRQGYPVYRHTSCAIALAEARPEQLGTWSGVVALDRCLPCECPIAQRGRCDAMRIDLIDRDGIRTFADEVAKFLEIESDAVEYRVATKQIRVNTYISEFDFNVILHAAAGRYSIQALAIEPNKAWQGPFATIYSKKEG
ncbi:hypothetical protein [Glycomyces endophyticus]|uniref:hypothetical protein n=1 Tax=Glycomyces endophyticus TaxID=480996 RepID=UPI0031D9E162